MKRLILELIITILFFLSCCYFYKDQQRISHNDGKGYDGFYYYEATKQIQEGNYHIKGEPPFVNRYANHFIIGKFSRWSGHNILDSAFIVNMFGMFLTVIMLLFWLRQFLSKTWIRLTLIFIFIFTWYVPIRNTIYEPMVPDPWGAVFFMAGLLLLNIIHKRYNANKSTVKQIIAFTLFVTLGTLFRESNIMLGFALFLILNPFKKIDFSFQQNILYTCRNVINQTIRLYWSKKNVLLLFPIITYIISSILINTLITAENTFDYSYAKALVWCFYSKSFPEFLTGTFIAYGPLLVLAPFFFTNFKLIFIEREDLSFLLSTAIFFGYLGGGDTERILFMSSFPLVYIMIGISIEKIFQSNYKWWLFVLFFLQTFAMRIYWNNPPHPSDIDKVPIPFFGLIGEDIQLLYLYSYYGSKYVHTILLMEYLLLAILTFIILKPRLVGKITFNQKN
jgi:hypothetical protein